MVANFRAIYGTIIGSLIGWMHFASSDATSMVAYCNNPSTQIPEMKIKLRPDLNIQTFFQSLKMSHTLCHVSLYEP